ncbi:hypothetical protein [Aquimarina spongiae]|uniref:Uncharacterized protein n=1 Tax=Aquimarina spongiae TaxID=570521 RepID=A0A1M6IG61_9FLAO|nr:hypothetical protein [Aquimarina spongiae]SHJ33336.1 hypothetical protein SAMN04488508_107334 [Aquimarina spongiae]
MFQKLPSKHHSKDFESFSEILESDGIIVFEGISDSFLKFKESFDDYQKEKFENEIKYLSDCYQIDQTSFNYYRNPEKLSKNYAKRLLASL